VADTITFDEGITQLLTPGKGWPSEPSFLLSTKPCSGTGSHKVTDTYVGGVGEITGTGYLAKKETFTISGSGEGERTLTFAQLAWLTESHTDWQNAKSVVAYDATTKKAFCAWNLQAGGAARTLGEANIEEKFTPTIKQ
jgi:hypothetical protein